jgi:cytochrome P450
MLHKKIGYLGKSFLLRFRKFNYFHSTLVLDELCSLSRSLTFAAMDTTSGALCRTLWLLAMHQDVQDKLRCELGQALNNDDDVLSYDDLVSLPYLDSICRETMRL